VRAGWPTLPYLPSDPRSSVVGDIVGSAFPPALFPGRRLLCGVALGAVAGDCGPLNFHRAKPHLIGNLLAAAFILWAFQRIFLASSRRYTQPYLSLHHPVLKERLITTIICALLIGTGFYMRPWLKLVDQDTAMITKGFPIHSSIKHQKSEEEQKQDEFTGEGNLP